MLARYLVRKKGKPYRRKNKYIKRERRQITCGSNGPANLQSEGREVLLYSQPSSLTVCTAPKKLSSSLE
ncbi:hypothetical protein AAFF_G00152920 [Aldrovandia affinis]|uniref:Uncharacterized protein n=1 Tax=Aldrovandia affinis TaxID=143900 RepID=A0AAD7W803_9TELE|nr:hypothetical protein AAFF_G00152920 [Aldrovandia affinis]